MSYYERWLASCIRRLVQHGLVTEQEIETGKPAPGSHKETPPLTAAVVQTIAFHRPSYRRESKAVASFEVGDHIRARNANPVGHTRLPRYARGKAGIIARQYGVFVFPDTNAHFLGEQPQYLYSVCFTARELWGESASPKDSVYLDLWESYLEHV
jgi:nitrile hydratase